MWQKIGADDTGAAAAEFALSLLVLLPLLMWMIRFGELMNLNHATVEAARLAVWEKAYGRPEADIRKMVTNTINNSARFLTNPRVSVTTAFRTESSRDDFKILAWSLVPNRSIADRLGLNYGNYYKTQVRVSGKLPFGIGYSLNRSHMLLADPWNLTDQNSDGKITSDKDLEPVIRKLYFYEPLTGGVVGTVANFGLDVFGKIQSYLGWVFQTFLNADLDIDPRGHPTLESVP